MLGSGSNGEFTFLDTIALASFFMGIINYDENLNQTDKQELQSDLSRELNAVLREVHKHLEEQDIKLNLIMEALRINGSR